MNLLNRCVELKWRADGKLAKLRYFFHSKRFLSAGRGGRIERNVRISPRLSLSIGDGVVLRQDVFLGGRGCLTIGDKAIINEGCMVACMGSIEIGANVMFGPRVYVLDVDHRFDLRDIPVVGQGYDIKGVVVEDGVWIGTGTVVTKGVRIGQGAVVGANSVVTRDLPAFCICAGAPARALKERP